MEARGFDSPLGFFQFLFLSFSLSLIEELCVLKTGPSGGAQLCLAVVPIHRELASC